jgi:hypothetical protein
MLDQFKAYSKRVSEFQKVAHNVFAVHEASPSRVIVLDNAYKELSSLSIKQDELLRQSLRCVENSLYKAAHVMAWASMMDFIEERISKKGITKLLKVRSAWKGKYIEDIRESYPEHQIIEAARDMNLFPKSVCKALIGLLNKRNECAHPSDYYPDINQTLGYISEIISRIRAMQIHK